MGFRKMATCRTQRRAMKVSPLRNPALATEDGFHDASETRPVALAHRQAMEKQQELHAPPLEIVATIDEAQQSPALDWPVVAVGASAGGLQAFREILENLPSDTGMAFVLITHLAPDHKSYMTEILAKHTKMPVVSIQDNGQPQPDHLYVLLPNTNVTLKEGRFHTSARPPAPRLNMAIDTFFRSVASEQKIMPSVSCSPAPTPTAPRD